MLIATPVGLFLTYLINHKPSNIQSNSRYELIHIVLLEYDTNGGYSQINESWAWPRRDSCAKQDLDPLNLDNKTILWAGINSVA